MLADILFAALVVWALHRLLWRSGPPMRAFISCQVERGTVVAEGFAWPGINPSERFVIKANGRRYRMVVTHVQSSWSGGPPIWHAVSEHEYERRGRV